jgi:hypothetical protein
MTFRELNAMIYMYRRMDEADRRYIVEMLGEEFGDLVGGSADRAFDYGALAALRKTWWRV